MTAMPLRVTVADLVGYGKEKALAYEVVGCADLGSSMMGTRIFWRY